MTAGAYVARAADGAVLYVGASRDIEARIGQHRRSAAWAQEAVAFELIPSESPFETEAILIRELSPRENRRAGHSRQRLNGPTRGVTVAVRPGVLDSLVEQLGEARTATALAVSQSTINRLRRGRVNPSSTLIANLITFSGEHFEDLFDIVDEAAA